MITLILTIHLTLAAIYCVSIFGLTIAAALRKRAPIVHTSAITSFGGIVGSGIILVAASPKAITQFCTSTFVASIIGVAAWAVYKRRAVALQPTESTVY